MQMSACPELPIKILEVSLRSRIRTDFVRSDRPARSNGRGSVGLTGGWFSRRNSEAIRKGGSIGSFIGEPEDHRSHANPSLVILKTVKGCLACFVFKARLGAEIGEMPDTEMIKKNRMVTTRAIIGDHDRGAIRSANCQQGSRLKRLAEQEVAVWIGNKEIWHDADTTTRREKLATRRGLILKLISS